MLNIWPDFLTYGFFAPLLTRLVLGLSFISFGYLAWRHGQTTSQQLLGIIEMMAAALIFIGLWTQPAAAVLSLLLVLNLFGRFKPASPVATPALAYQFLALAALLSLLLTGAGGLAFDLPL